MTEHFTSYKTRPNHELATWWHEKLAKTLLPSDNLNIKLFVGYSGSLMSQPPCLRVQ
jgi:hypothetical protein